MPLISYMNKNNKVTSMITSLNNPLNFFVGTLIGAFTIYLVLVWRIEYNPVVVEYLKVLLSAPAVFLIVLVILFLKFDLAIDYFIRNLRLKYRDIEATSQQEIEISPNDERISKEKEKEFVKLSKQDAQSIVIDIEDLTAKGEKQKETIERLQNSVIQFANRSELFEFKYLNNILVLNTKLALNNLYLTGSTSKEYFIHNVFVPPGIKDKLSERLAIHTVLFVNGLIEETEFIVKVSEKGVRYLKFIGFLK